MSVLKMYSCRNKKTIFVDVPYLGLPHLPKVLGHLNFLPYLSLKLKKSILLPVYMSKVVLDQSGKQCRP